MYCPCCDTESAFLPFGVKPRQNARCPHCGALERHRLLWLFLHSRHQLLSAGMRLLHVAPEPILRRLFEATPGVHYISADLDAASGVRLDITRLPFAPGTLDGVVCNHVLEHVPEDRAALRELRRALRPTGWAILQSPLDGRREETYEDPSVTDPGERERLFDQFDHVRIYGRDYATRLRAAGFHVDVVTFAETLQPDDVTRCGLRSENIYLCRPAASAA